MSDSVSRILKASLRVGRDTSNWRMSSSSVGRLAPSARSPRTIRARRYAAIVSPVLAGLMLRPTGWSSLNTVLLVTAPLPPPVNET
jgi:hypothetical protein